MRRPLTRVLSSALAATVVTVTVGAVPAFADTSSGSGLTPAGTGTVTNISSVLSLKVGTLLDLGLLTDTGGGSILNGTAGTSLVPLTLKVPALNLDLSTPAIKTDGTSSATGQLLDLASLGIPKLLASATINPSKQSSDLSSSAAHANIAGAVVNNLSLIGGGLLNVNLLGTGLTSASTGASAVGDPTMDISAVNILDLGQLISGLGGSLTSLPLGVLSDLTSKLGLPVPNATGSGGTLLDQVTSLTGAITSLQTTLTNTTTALTTPINSVVTGLVNALNLGAIPVVGTTLPTLVPMVTNLVNGLITQITDLLKGVLGSLDNLSLISLSGSVFGAHALAANTLAGSAASVANTPMTVKVLGQTIPGLDLTNVTGTLDTALNQVTGLLNSVLSGVLGLPQNLISLNILGKQTGVLTKDGFNVANAGVSLLSLKIAPLTGGLLGGLLGGAGGTTGGATSASGLLSGLLGGTGGLGALTSAVPNSNAMGGLSSLLGVTSLLTGGVDLEIGSLASQAVQQVKVAAVAPPAQVNPPAAAIPPPAVVPTQLPHTGGNPVLPIAGMIVASLGLAAVRMRRLGRIPARSTASS